MRSSRLLAAVILTLVPVACDSGGGALTLRGALETFIRESCNRGHQCRDSYPGTAAEFEAELNTSVAACAGYIQSAEGEAFIAAYENALAAGRLIYDAGNARACFDAVSAQSCADFWQGTDPSPLCDYIFVGTVPSGGACTLGDECAGRACTLPSMTCV